MNFTTLNYAVQYIRCSTIYILHTSLYIVLYNTYCTMLHYDVHSLMHTTVNVILHIIHIVVGYILHNYLVSPIDSADCIYCHEPFVPNCFILLALLNQIALGPIVSDCYKRCIHNLNKKLYNSCSPLMQALSRNSRNSLLPLSPSLEIFFCLFFPTVAYFSFSNLATITRLLF